MANNPNLCKHVWKFASYFQTSGYAKPVHNIVLFCEKCAKVKKQEIKK